MHRVAALSMLDHLLNVVADPGSVESLMMLKSKRKANHVLSEGVIQYCVLKYIFSAILCY